jgi:hypothetical protein
MITGLITLLGALGAGGLIYLCFRWDWKWMMWKGQGRHVYYPHPPNDIGD